MSFRNLDDMTEAEIWVELHQITSLDQQQWLDIKSLPPDVQKDTILTYAHMDWTQPGTPLAQRVLSILSVLGVVVGAASGVTGLVSGIEAVLKG